MLRAARRTLAVVQFAASLRRASGLSPSPFVEFAAAGPLFEHARERTAAEWESLGARVVGALLAEQQRAGAGPAPAADAPPSELPRALAVRAYHLYLPLYFWCERVVHAARAEDGGAARPVAIALSAPQGCGKTTLVEFLVELFAAHAGLRCAAVSFDDFYLEGEGLERVAAADVSNELLGVRGNAGTHDVALGRATLEALLGAGRGGAGAGERAAPARKLALPRFDKALRGGRGDRAPAAEWPEVDAPVDVVLLEGWMAGFKPLAAGDAAAAARGGHAGLAQVGRERRGTRRREGRARALSDKARAADPPLRETFPSAPLASLSRRRSTRTSGRTRGGTS